MFLKFVCICISICKVKKMKIIYVVIMKWGIYVFKICCNIIVWFKKEL